MISPNGKRFAFVKTSDETRALHAFDLGKGEALAGAKINDPKLRNVRWVDDDNMLVEIFADQLTADRLYRVKVRVVSEGGF